MEEANTVSNTEEEPGESPSVALDANSTRRCRRSDVQEQVAAYLRSVMPQADSAGSPAAALVPWFCDVLLSEHSLKAYGRDLADLRGTWKSLGFRRSKSQLTQVKMYKAALLKAGVRPATIARRLSVLRGAYQQFAEKGLMDWETVRAIQAVKAPPVRKNSTPSLTQSQAISLLQAIPTDTPQGLRDLAMLQTFFITGCRVSAIVRARVGDLEFDGVEHYLHVTEKRNKESRKILLDAARRGAGVHGRCRNRERQGWGALSAA